MKKITAIEIAILLIAGLLPLLWLKEGYIISNGDDFPLFLNPQHVFSIGTSLWSHDFLGYATPAPAYALYQYPAVFLSYLGFSIGNIQIFYQVILFMIGALGMYYFSKIIYPELKIAPFVAGFFYMFNIFALTSRQNTGFIWIYAFLPLLLALFAKIVKSTYEHNNKTANKNIIYFSLLSVVAFSFAAINPANVALGLFGIAILALYYLVKYRKQLLPLFKSFGKIAGISVPLNLWWIIPILNYYFLSNQVFNSTISVGAWDWTQWRSSFLNLFWLNGFWAWTDEYIPYIKEYSNPILIVLVFVPFIIGASALLFKSQRSRFNAYIMGAILVLLFLAKGVRGPLGQLNLLFYQNFSLMSMFREPVSKFTLLIIPFLALLIGFGADKIASFRLPKLSFRSSKILIILVLMLTFLVAVQPLIITTNPQGQIVYNYTIESITGKLPYSSYVKIPDYWYQATDWINSQPGDGKVLLTPLDDFYQMPYNWTNGLDGYYGTDQLIDGLINKPIISTNNLNGYKFNNDTATTLQELSYAIQFGRVDEFKALLDILSVKYILQRNDIVNNLNRTLQIGNIQSATSSIMSPSQMNSFFAEQPYLSLAKTFGNIDIYEYTDSKVTLHAVSLSSLQQSNIAVQTNITMQQDWNFNNSETGDGWQATVYSNTSTTPLQLMPENGNLTALLSNSTGYSEKIESPLLQSQYENIYTITSKISGVNTADVNITIAQYGEDMTLLNNTIADEVNYGTFSWTNTTFRFETLQDAKYFSVQVWFDLDPKWVRNNTLSIDEINVTGTMYSLSVTGLDNILNETTQNQVATILKVQGTTPTNIVATVNAITPFILATSYALDDSWEATVNGQQIKPTTLYLGLAGFQINQTGQFDISIEYKPQVWFNYASAISIVTLGVLFAVYLYVSSDKIKGIFRKTSTQKREP